MQLFILEKNEEEIVQRFNNSIIFKNQVEIERNGIIGRKKLYLLYLQVTHFVVIQATNVYS